MELNEALSNPQLQVRLSRLGAVHGRLVDKAAAVTTVLELAEQPMRAREIHAAAQ